MRLIKMTDKMLKVGEDRGLTLDEFIGSMKGERNGQFLVPKGWIGEGELGVSEAVSFSHKREVKYVARTSSGREENNGRDSDKFPYKFRMDPTSIRKVKLALDALQRRLDALGTNLNLKGRGWTKIPETTETLKMFEQIWDGGSPV